MSAITYGAGGAMTAAGTGRRESPSIHRARSAGDMLIASMCAASASVGVSAA